MGTYRHCASGLTPPKLGMLCFRGEADSSHHPGDAETTNLMSQMSTQCHAINQQPLLHLASKCKAEKAPKSPKTGAKGAAWVMPDLTGQHGSWAGWG